MLEIELSELFLEFQIEILDDQKVIQDLFEIHLDLEV
jgi:hypothetical protein